jgi:hypothetical protein
MWTFAGEGWAIARHYPEPGLRPYCDFGLVRGAAEYARPKRLCNVQKVMKVM